jgi:tetratricopeptide (TPR) repeat protein
MSSSRALSAQAKAAEQRGDLDEAVRLYVQAQDFEEAGRVLVAKGDYSRAGRVLYRAVGLPLERMFEADAAQKKLAVKAGICLARANETQPAVAVFIAAGDLQRAVDTLSRAGDTVGAAKVRAQMQGSADVRVGGLSAQASAGKYVDARRLEERGDAEGALAQYIQGKAYSDAGRLSRTLGKLEQAADLFEQGGLFYEAAVCFHDLNDLRRCLSALLRVSKEHARYRGACVKAISIALSFGELGFELDQLVSRFVSTGPQSQDELDAFVNLGSLYERVGFPENARECYRKVLERQPNHPVQNRLRELEAALRGSNMVYAQILREDSAFRGDTGRQRALSEDPVSSTFAVRAELSELPELPDLKKKGSSDVSEPKPRVPAASPASTLIGSAGPGHPSLDRSLPPGPRAQSLEPPRPEPQPRVQPQQSAVPTQAFQGAAAPVPAATPPTTSGLLELTPGALIAERYRLEKKLGQGGTAAVFRATDLELEEEVAIKIFTMPVDDPDLVRRFKQELSVARKLSHPNVVRLHDIGAHRGFRFLTMEVLQGEDLASVLTHGPLALPVALDYLMQAASGLALAHSYGIVHRDIKPENFFITTQGVLKVMDFGIAKKESAQKRTQAGFIAGTPPYMSPEQINGFADVTALADVYSLGVVAYEMFAGVLPFVHEELMPLLVMHMSETPRAPNEHNPELPDPLNALILRLLEKKPDKRVQSMKELVELLSGIKPLLR